jgi:ADP-glucose pyrophosphorylase
MPDADFSAREIVTVPMKQSDQISQATQPRADRDGRGLSVVVPFVLGDNVFQANLEDVVRRQREDRADAAFLTEVPWEDASRYGVCDTNTYGGVTDVVETPEDPPSNPVVRRMRYSGPSRNRSIGTSETWS